MPKTILYRTSPLLAVRLLIVTIIVLACSSVVHAELPPDVYREMQAEAPESLVITVQGVHAIQRKQSWGQRTYVTVSARVKQVHRSKSKLKTGRLIYIRYTRDQHNSPMAGPGLVPLLRRGQTCPAFLKFSGKGTGNREAKRIYYAPAAGSHSFNAREVDK